MSKHFLGSVLNAGHRGLTLAPLRKSVLPCASRTVSSSPIRSAAPAASSDHHDHGHDQGDGHNGWLFGENVRSSFIAPHFHGIKIILLMLVGLSKISSRHAFLTVDSIITVSSKIIACCHFIHSHLENTQVPIPTNQYSKLLPLLLGFTQNSQLSPMKNQATAARPRWQTNFDSTARLSSGPLPPFFHLPG